MDDSSNDSSCCPICCESITNSIKLPCCNQEFNMTCLENWKPDVDDYVNGRRTCPCCRALIPATQEVMDTILLYDEVSKSIATALKDPDCELPIPPFPGMNNRSTKAELRHYYEKIESVYGERVRLFKEKYGNFADQTIIPTSPQRLENLPLSVVSAVANNDYNVVRRFFGSLPIPPKRLNAICPSKEGNTLLHFAVQAQKFEMVKVLLSLGANVNATNAKRHTPLHFAVRIEGTDDAIARTLIRWGAKKVSSIFPSSVVSTGTDHLLAATAEARGKVELAQMLKAPLRGRNCKFTNTHGLERIGTVVHYSRTRRPCTIRLDDHSFPVPVDRDSPGFEICKPDLFDFRDIHREDLFPDPICQDGSSEGSALFNHVNDHGAGSSFVEEIRYFIWYQFIRNHAESHPEVRFYPDFVDLFEDDED